MYICHKCSESARDSSCVLKLTLLLIGIKENLSLFIHPPPTIHERERLPDFRSAGALCLSERENSEVLRKTRLKSVYKSDISKTIRLVLIWKKEVNFLGSPLPPLPTFPPTTSSTPTLYPRPKDSVECHDGGTSNPPGYYLVL